MPIGPNSVIGIIGGGQLGRMTAMAAERIGYRAHIFTSEKDSPASQVAERTTVAEYTDIKALTEFAGAVDVITFEFENIPPEALELLAGMRPVHPSPEVLKTCRNRVREKTFISGLGIGTAAFRKVTSAQELKDALEAIGTPSVLKTSELGYDGKGQVVIRDAAEADAAWNALATKEAILEAFVDFRMEVSVIVARGADGQTQCYPAVQNIHKNHILDVTLAPAPISTRTAEEAATIATRIAVALDLRGLVAVEMFVSKEGKLLVNELAPRPHNSGHWTMDAAATSQFEQLVRAVCGLPLGSPERLCDAEMKNLIGDDVREAGKYLEDKNARLHLYGKKDIRPGRKMGHVNFLRKS